MKRRIREEIFAQRRFRQLLVLLTVLSLILGLLIVPVESWSPESNIQTVEEGLWWAATTVSSVGYGDYVPVTTLGRIIGVTLQAAGVMMFGLLIGLVTETLNRHQEEVYWSREFERFTTLENQLTEVQKQLRYLVRSEVDHNEKLSEDEL